MGAAQRPARGIITTDKRPVSVAAPKSPAQAQWSSIVGFVLLLGLHWQTSFSGFRQFSSRASESPYGHFPRPQDPFRFLPCTNETLPPALDDDHPERTWSRLYDPDPSHWSWGDTSDASSSGHQHGDDKDPYAGRGIFLCGYLDVPLDYTNDSDPRIVRLAVTKFQVSFESKSERTIVVEPGGPGASGTLKAWRSGQDVTERLSDGRFDVLGWDPRGVNASLPALSCFPYDADRDHWALKSGEHLEVSPSPRAQLEFVDAMSDAVFAACQRIHGDFPRFVSTAFVARDLELIRQALDEDDLTGYLVSYGTGIGQTYANMFPQSVGRMILDGTEYVRDQRLLGGFGWTALDNVTDAWHDGFLGECVAAGPDHCALAKPRQNRGGDDDAAKEPVTVESLEKRMHSLISGLIKRPIPGYTRATGPSLVTYSSLVMAIYGALYNARSWPALARMLFELEAGNSTLAAAMLERKLWQYKPTLPPPPKARPKSEELGQLVICADAYDAPGNPGSLDMWEDLWVEMVRKSWISGNSRFQNVFPCRHFVDYWPKPAEVYRGDLNNTLRHPVLLIAETYDPATPLRNGRRLLHEMGHHNARLIAHHGYGHASHDTSNCTDSIAKAFILEGKVPDADETACFADEKPYLYGIDKEKAGTQGVAEAVPTRDPLELWDDHLAVLSVLNPRLLPKEKSR
ncbi:hypothetical protein HIM_04562 [Hirsutella minnesotensis 3608]|uniref:AB hydrolase-1 domain-containing protein n=1 Tax=Hirsutella minnesotensis 3608 TaxID=1043627 RepID=A0A0F7ZL83_9HYPO|nr:hypothetical protein HIM_04562 [Hirsutella minnesotensis 3608]